MTLRGTLRIPGGGAVATMAGASLVAAAVAFVVNILSARVLGPENRGHVALVLQLAYITAPVIGVGADRALLRGGDQRYVVPSLLAMLTGAVAVGAVAGLAYGAWFAMAAVVALVTVCFSLYRSVAFSSGRRRTYIVSFLLYQASVLAGSAALAAAGSTVWQWWAGVYAVPGIVLAAYAMRNVRRESSLPVAGAWTALRANGALLAASLSSLIVLRFNRIVLPLIAGAESLGLFIVVATATEPLYWVAQALADQRTSAGASTAPRNRAGMLAASTRDAVFFVPVGIAGGVVLALVLVPIFGPAYGAAKPLVFPLVVAAVVLALYRQASGRLLASARPNRLGAAETSVAAASLAIYPIAIIHGGALGAAWGAVIVYALAWGCAVTAYPSTPAIQRSSQEIDS